MNQTSPRLLFIGCVSLFVFMYAPLLVVIVFSLTPTEYGVSWEGFTLKWYQAVFDNKNIQAALKVSLMVAIPCVLISTAIGTITALTLYRSECSKVSQQQTALFRSSNWNQYFAAVSYTSRSNVLASVSSYN